MRGRRLGFGHRGRSRGGRANGWWGRRPGGRRGLGSNGAAAGDGDRPPAVVRAGAVGGGGGCRAATWDRDGPPPVIGVRGCCRDRGRRERMGGGRRRGRCGRRGGGSRGDDLKLRRPGIVLRLRRLGRGCSGARTGRWSGVRSGGLDGVGVSGVPGVGIAAPLVLGRGLEDRRAVVPGGGDGLVRLGTVGRLDVGQPCWCGSGRLYRWTLGGPTGVGSTAVSGVITGSIADVGRTGIVPPAGGRAGFHRVVGVTSAGGAEAGRLVTVSDGVDGARLGRGAGRARGWTGAVEALRPSIAAAAGTARGTTSNRTTRAGGAVGVAARSARST